MITHHDARPFEQALSESVQAMQVKLDQMIHSATPRVQRAIDQVENDVPEDAVVAGRAIRFRSVLDEAVDATEDRRAALRLSVGQLDGIGLHDHAFSQVAYKAKVHNAAPYLADLLRQGEWGTQLVAQNLNEIYSRMNGDRFLLRMVRGQLRGFLSDQFRRLDSRPLLDAFVGAMRKHGAVPIDGFALETKVRLRAIIPQVFQPFPGEILAFGAELSDSDFGDGALALSGILMRMWCTNTAVTQDVLRKVHLGSRLPQDVRLSQRTLELDTRTMASAINDLAGNVLGPGAIEETMDVIRQANAEKVSPGEINAWVKRHLTGGEGKQVQEKFASADVEMLPPGQTKWRWSNAVSWLAGETKDDRRRAELQEAAGLLLAGKGAKAV